MRIPMHAHKESISFDGLRAIFASPRRKLVMICRDGLQVAGRLYYPSLRQPSPGFGLLAEALRYRA